MTDDQAVQEAAATRDAAAAERDQAVDTVVAAYRSRAGRWLAWVAYSIADRTPGILDKVTIASIKQAVGELADQVEHQPLLLSYSSVYMDDRDANWGGAAHVLDRATSRELTQLGRSLRRMGLRPGPYFPDDSLVSRFKGDDGFSDLLMDWARAERALRQADRRYRAAASLSDLGGLRKMWGQDASSGDAESDGRSPSGDIWGT